MDSASAKTRFPIHGFVGLATIIAAEYLLFSGNQFVGHWMTPIVWTGYILFVDAWVYRFDGRSLLMNDRLEFLAVAVISIGSLSSTTRRDSGDPILNSGGIITTWNRTCGYDELDMIGPLRRSRRRCLRRRSCFVRCSSVTVSEARP